MDARDEILARVGAALAGASAPDVPRRYRLVGDMDAGARERRFKERVEEYGGAVLDAGVAHESIASVLAERGVRRLGIAAGLDAALRPTGVELVVDGGHLTPEELDALDGALTSCAVACAETGTIALDGGPGQGRRALTLVPDLHVCVVRRTDIVETVPELLARLAPSAREGRPIVLVSFGPSATSDIELTRVEGVHGPRSLVVVLAD